MGLQNVRALLWRGEDLGSTGAGTRELIVQTKLPASARPQISSMAFVSSLDISSFLGTTVPAGVTGLNRLVVNKSPDYWLTLWATVGSQAVQAAIAPLSTFFVPTNMVSGAAQAGLLTMNSTWPVLKPMTGTGFGSVPVASSTTALTVDLVVEQ
jgi:hypothetical protein